MKKITNKELIFYRLFKIITSILTIIGIIYLSNLFDSNMKKIFILFSLFLFYMFLYYKYYEVKTKLDESYFELKQSYNFLQDKYSIYTKHRKDMSEFVKFDIDNEISDLYNENERNELFSGFTQKIK